MTLTRYQIRNEYGLADKQLYQSTGKEDPEALFEGSSMAGLVGVLRQLGDLAEFAGEVFHCLHEELTTTAARGHGLAMRLQQLETELPSVEIPVLSQTDHSTFFYEPGLEWHLTLQREENLISPRKLPHCIMDSYEECRGPPQLDLLDKFDVVGSGSCLKRYSDPSLLKTSSAVVTTSKLSEDERPKKKVSHTTSRERLEDSHTSHAKLHQLFLLEHVENGVTNTEFHVKLKRRHLDGHPINSSSGTSYMEKFLKNYLPYCERVHVTMDQSSLAMETDVREDLPIPSLVYPSNGDTRKEREMESISNDERGVEPYIEGGPIICSSVNLCGMVNNDTDAPASTDSEANVVESDDKTGGNLAFPIFGQTEMCTDADVTQTEVLAQFTNVLKNSSEEGESEDGTKVLPKGYVEDDHSQHVFSVETESEMSLTALVEDQFSSITNQEMEIESHCLLIQNQNIEDLSLDADETNSQDGSPMNTEHSGHISTFEICSESGALMSDIPSDLHTGTKNLSTSSWQEDALDNSDLAEISSDYGQEDPETMSIIADGSSELEAPILDTQRDSTIFVDDNDETSLNDKAGETMPEVDPHESLLGSQECLSPEHCIQTHDQGTESPSESGSENPIAAAAAESLPPQDVPSKEALTCNEDLLPSSVTEIEALHAPHQETFTSLIGHISEPVLSIDMTDQENCLDLSTVASSTSLHETPQADTEITPPLPPLPPTQWWLGKLVESATTTETQFPPVTCFHVYTEESKEEAVTTSAQTTLNEPSKETEERSPSESFSSVSLLTAEATPEAESTIGLEALEWFSQNLREHTNPNLAKLEEEPQFDHPLEPPGETEQDNSLYEQNEKIEKLPRDKVDSLVIGIDRSMLRKVSERNKTQVGARMEETDSLLEIIRSKSFNLRPADASVRHNFQVAVPITNLKVAAILEKANTLRHAMAGSDDDHDSNSWSE